MNRWRLEMEAARFCRNPDLPRGGMTIDDDLACVREIQFDDAARLDLEIPIGIGFVLCRFQSSFDSRQFCIRDGQELPFLHISSVL